MYNIQQYVINYNILYTATTPGPLELTFDSGFGVFLGEAADGEGDGFPQPQEGWGGLLTGLSIQCAGVCHRIKCL